ncbi:MAG: TraB/GumN family protein [Chthoniobacterales bacterium]
MRILAASLGLRLGWLLAAVVVGSSLRAVAEEVPPPFLWRIESPGAEAPSFLYGTIHLPRPELARIRDNVAPAFESADAVYTEIPMDAATLLAMSTKLFLPDGKTLKDVLPPDVYEAALAELDAMEFDVPLAPRDRMKIWAFTVSLATLEDELRNPGMIPLDMLLFQRAAMAGKETGGLETAEEQLAIFEDISEEDQIALLRDTLAQLATARETGVNFTDQLVDSYLSGDLERLETDVTAMTLPGKSELTDRLMIRLLDQRNVLMAERMEAKIAGAPEKSFFFAVGAAHLYGEQGVLALLEKSGAELFREESLKSQPSTPN